MNREQLVDRGAGALTPALAGLAFRRECATAVLDAVLPQITTVEQLEALPQDTKVIDKDGDVWWKTEGVGWLCMIKDGTGASTQWVIEFGPLTVVWQP